MRTLVRFVAIAVALAVGIVILMRGILPQEAAQPAADAGSSAAQAGQFGDLFGSGERARVIEIAADHDPMARGTTVRLAVAVEMLPGMHVNANPPSEDWLIPVQATIAGVDGLHVIEAFYPEAESRKFPYSEEPFLVYEDTFVIGLLVAVDESVPAGGHPLEILLDYQACNDEACFNPAQTSADLDIMVVADPADARAASSAILDRAPFPRRP
jgi:hypothetical protein